MSDEVPADDSMAAKGGRAAAAKMTSEERKERAKKAAEARWMKSTQVDKVVDAPHCGVIRIGDLEIPCAVFNDGTRVVSERGVLKALGVGRSGYAHNRAKADAEGGAGIPQYLAPINIKPFIDTELVSVLQKPLWYRPASGPNSGLMHKGVRADLLPKICNVWLKARDAGVIRGTRQETAVANADIMLRGLAEVGITALVDEATGFQDARAKDALAKILEKFVAKEIQNYVKLLPINYYKGLCRLRGIPFSADLQLPRYFGHLTNNIVYARLAPAVLDELRRKNPVVNGRRKGRHYNWLTPNLGHPKLLQHMGSVVTLMELAGTDWDEFLKMLNRIHPPYEATMSLFAHLEDDVS